MLDGLFSRAPGAGSVLRAVLSLAAVMALGGCPAPVDKATLLAQRKQAETLNQIDPDSDKHLSSRQKLGLHTQSTSMELRVQPMPIVAGQDSFLNFKVLDPTTTKADPDQATGIEDFNMVQGKLMHLIIVSDDLNWYRHVYPRYIDLGSFSTDLTFMSAGRYTLFAEYKPANSKTTAGRLEVARKRFNVKAPPIYSDAVLGSVLFLPPPSPTVKGWRSVDVKAHDPDTPDVENGPAYKVGLTVESHIESGSPYDFGATLAVVPYGKPVDLHFKVSDATGKPVTDIQPPLGALGFAAVISADTDIFVDAVPETNGKIISAPGGPDVRFQVFFPAPGTYKIWGDFQIGDMAVTAPFVVKVGPASINKR